MTPLIFELCIRATNGGVELNIFEVNSLEFVFHRHQKCTQIAASSKQY